MKLYAVAAVIVISGLDEARPVIALRRAMSRKRAEEAFRAEITAQIEAGEVLAGAEAFVGSTVSTEVAR